MELTNKDKSYKIKVNSKKNKIIVSKGFVIITSGTHYSANKVRADIIEKDYIIPDNVTIG
jgi:hypothetical protein